MGDHADDRFVAPFDMLGMSAPAKREPDLAWGKLSALARARDERLHLGIERTDTAVALTADRSWQGYATNKRTGKVEPWEACRVTRRLRYGV
jgi:hypothetical protein